MNRGSDSFAWGIRWETVERQADQPLYGALLPDTFATLSQAQREQRRLAKTQPTRPDPSGVSEPRPVRYVLFARGTHDVQEL